MIRRTVVPAVLLTLVIAGCARSQSDTGSVEPGAAPSVSVLPESTSAQPEPSVTTSGKPAAGTTTVTGTVTAGVEPNCLLLQAGKALHLLVFGDEALRASAVVGSKVRVTGTPQPGTMTTCQQGEPFLVSSVTPG
ncbi:hypothetical protein [Actinoplanes awajinensis]|uniref:DUF5666 domain-containing protein n=1 Tax=Actinoplanes awajinensis subsp. mycoplanecinus TaxID=135947 RepID=A0A0X3VCQ0_9ACTN|nr:hypothetical protein [Actinoplanes awajinensis]KUL42500.1 hypothetical protein ADL15_01100 [Actinoplanes awajinensis subsp. mycoplanecinus]